MPRVSFASRILFSLLDIKKCNSLDNTNEDGYGKFLLHLFDKTDLENEH